MKKTSSGSCPPDGASHTRRALLKRSLAVAIGLAARAGNAAEPEPAKQPPQVGDELWFPSWETESRAITVDDVRALGPPVTAYPYDPKASVLRERSRLNQILLIRIDPKSPDTTGATGGVVAYSGICTHAACGVTEWNADTHVFQCPCHGSEFNPAARGMVVTGPAPRPLPRLPIKIIEGKLVIAGPFSGPVGAKKG